MRNGVLLILASLLSFSLCQADPIVFPSGYIPFTSLYYMTHRDQNGYSLVFGQTPHLNDLLHYLQSLPPLTGNQQYANGPVELAPGMFFTNVLVPTSAERYGDFRDFGAPIYNPFAGPIFGSSSQFAVNYGLPPGIYLSFAQSIIPTSLLGDFFAFRISSSDPVSTTPEPSALLLFAIGLPAILGAYRIARRRKHEHERRPETEPRTQVSGLYLLRTHHDRSHRSSTTAPAAFSITS